MRRSILLPSGPSSILILALLFLAPASPLAHASGPQWVEVSSPHFTVYTDAGEKQGRHTLDQFERMRWVFRTLFANVNADPIAPIEVWAMHDNRGFQSLEPAVYLAKGQISLGGYFLKTQDQNYILLRLDAQDEQHPYAIVYHEYTHLEFSGEAAWLPLWLNEGLAEFFENSEIRDKDVRVGEPLEQGMMELRHSAMIPLPVLFKVDVSSPYYHREDKGSIFYAESWALTHMLMVDDRMQKTHRLDDYMHLVAAHQDPVAAAEQAFGDLRKLETALAYYIHSDTYRVFIMNSALAPIDESAFTVRAVSPLEADAARAGVLVSVGRFTDARALLDSVLKQDPNNARACEEMGMLALRQGDHAEARTWYAKAVQLDSKSYLAHYYFAAMSMADDPSSAGDAGIEASLRQAIALNPSFAPAYNQLAMFYGMRREHLDDAVQLIGKAVQLDPGNIGYRINAANVLMGAGRYDDAQKTLQAALKVARSPQEAAMVQGRIEQAAQIQAAAADHAQTPVFADAGSSSHVIVVNHDTPPKHPTEPATGLKHSVEGVIRGVSCSYPSVLEFHIESPQKTVSVYTNDYFKLDVTAVGFTPTGDINPCNGFEGRKAKVQYAEVSDKTVDGQIVSVELHK